MSKTTMHTRLSFVMALFCLGSSSYGEGDLLFKGGIQLTNSEVIGSLVWWHALANRSMKSAIAIPKFPFVPYLQQIRREQTIECAID